jgi:gas vesicle protein
MASNKLIAGVLAGVAVGSIVAYLFATDKGSKMRKNLTKNSGKYMESLKGQFGDLIDNLAGTFFSNATEELTHMHSPQQYAKKQKQSN